MQEDDVVLAHPRAFALGDVEAELVAGPGGLARGGEAEHKDGVRLELAGLGVARAHELGAGVQAEHAAPVGAEHALAQEALLALAGVVGVKGDVDVVLGDGEDLQAELVLLRHVNHDELGVCLPIDEPTTPTTMEA